MLKPSSDIVIAAEVGQILLQDSLTKTNRNGRMGMREPACIVHAFICALRALYESST